ncbi:MAG: type II secretion system protein N [Pseudomonadales bacterium]|nr:type II secretion system protein N [Pseudomonadales bacterium]
MKVRSYIAIGVISFLIFAVALFPANLVWSSVASSVASAVPGKVQTVGGTIWDGFVVVDLRIGSVKGLHLAKWQVHPLNLLLGEVSLDLMVESEGLRASGDAYIGLLGKGIQDLTGQISASVAKPILKQFDASAEGGLNFKGLTVAMSGDEIADASGVIRWDGGKVSYRSGRSTQTVDFPAVVGTLTESEGSLNLSLIEMKGKKALGEAMLRPDGIGGVKVLQRAMTLAGFSSSPGDDDKVLLNIQRPLF